MKLTTEEFLQYLRRSGLVEKDLLEKTLSDLQKTLPPEKYGNPDFIAANLVHQDLITEWHVRQLMRRKYKGFFLRQYRILDHLGDGGMSSVFLAEHTVMQRQAAIKVLPKKRLTNSAYLERFVREAQAIASLDNANIVRAYDIDQVDDIHYIVMEYFKGDNLRQRVEKTGPLGFEDAVNYMLQAARGLAHAHRIGIIHRDVKPDNILVNDEGTVKLLDMGLALLDDSLVKGDFTEDESKVLGTADYLAPEQAVNSAKVDLRADIYGLGGTLYYCLTGHPPFPTGTIAQRIQAHKTETPKSIYIDRPEAPDDLVNICSKMMAKKPEDRFQSSEDLIAIFQYWLIHHGFATEKDFPAFSEEEEQKLSDNETLWSFNTLSTKSIFDQEADSFSDSDSRLASTINLFSGESSNGSRLSGLWGNNRNSGIVLSDRSGTISSLNDPFEMALQEATSTHSYFSEENIDLPTKNNEKDPINKNAGKDSGVKNIAKTSALNSTGIKRSSVIGKETADNTVDESPSDIHWMRLVPVWFWALFFSGYVAAIFLAGILFALLVKLGNSE